MKKVMEQLWVLAQYNGEPIVLNNNLVPVVVADTKLEALERFKVITGSIEWDIRNVFTCSIHHGRSALYVRAK